MLDWYQRIHNSPKVGRGRRCGDDSLPTAPELSEMLLTLHFLLCLLQDLKIDHQRVKSLGVRKRSHTCLVEN
jgi:hypothetical protein